MRHEIYTPVEEGMFNMETASTHPEIFLRPKESVNIPFKFLSLKADHTVHPQVCQFCMQVYGEKILYQGAAPAGLWNWSVKADNLALQVFHEQVSKVKVELQV